MNGKLPRPAVIIILIMVLINAFVILYAYDRSTSADDKLRSQASHIRANVQENRTTLNQLEDERQLRSDQNCEFAERTHLRDVQDLRGTYDYLTQAEEHQMEKDSLLYKLVLAQVPRTISNGETDLAPEYCDEKGYGLKEPDPVIPKRPSFLPKEIIRAADKLKTKGIRLDNQPIVSQVSN